MYWILFVMAALVSVVIAIFVGGLATPRNHVASRAITLKAAPPAVWALVRDVARYPEWRDDVQGVDMLPTTDGRVRWREIGRQGSLSYVATADESPVHFGARITDEDLPYGGEWQWDLLPAHTGTRLVITERGEVRNPLFRFIGRYIIGHTRTMDTYLRDLAMQLGEQARPVGNYPDGAR